MTLNERREIIGHVEWQSRVDAVLKEFRSSDKANGARETALKKLHELGVPDWAAVKWIDGKTA